MTNLQDFPLEDLIESQSPEEFINYEKGGKGAVLNIPVQVSAVLGRATLSVGQLLKLGRGAVIELDRRVGDAIDIYVNNRLVARGEIVVIEDRLGVTMTEIMKSEQGNTP